MTKGTSLVKFKTEVTYMETVTRKVENFLMTPPVFLVLCYIFLTGTPLVSDFQRDIVMTILSNIVSSSIQ